MSGHKTVGSETPVNRGRGRQPRLGAAARAGTQLDAPSTGRLAAAPTVAESERITPRLASLAVPIETLTRHPRNPRHGDLGAIGASLSRFGQLKPIVVQASTGYVVAGNHLLAAARELGWDELAATVVDLDDTTASAYMLADNRTSDLGTYDDALLAAILQEQASAGNLAGTGYGLGDVDELVARLLAEAERRGDADAIPELPDQAEVDVKRGEIWRMGRHRLACGDATDPADVAALLAGAEPTLLTTDPPYGVSLDTSWRDGVVGPRARRGRTGSHRTTSLAGDKRIDWSEAFALVPSLQVGYLWHAAIHASEVAAGLERIGFEIVSQII
jgi:hypothetical protein